MSHGRKERTPAKLDVLAQAREKAKIVIALLPCRKISRSLDQLETFAKDHGHSLLELAFSWLLAKPKVATVIAGATSPQQVQSNIEATAWALSAKEVEEVDQITKKSLAR